MTKMAEQSPTWFTRLTLGWWRALILSALASQPASYDPAEIDKIIAANKQ